MYSNNCHSNIYLLFCFDNKLSLYSLKLYTCLCTVCDWCFCSCLCIVCVVVSVVSVCVSVMGTWAIHTESEWRGPFGNNGGLLSGVPCFPFLGTGCPSCNMITVTTVAIAVATQLQVNKMEEGPKGVWAEGYKGKKEGMEDEDKGSQGGQWSSKTRTGSEKRNCMDSKWPLCQFCLCTSTTKSCLFMFPSISQHHFSVQNNWLHLWSLRVRTYS